MYSKLVGVSFRDSETQARVLRLEYSEPVILVREPDNEHDTNAVRVYTEDQVFLGYLAAKPREDWLTPVADIARALDESDVVEAWIHQAGRKSPTIEIYLA